MSNTTTSQSQVRHRTMASTTGIPGVVSDATESSPLLGRPGPVKQKETHPLPLNFISGWGILAVLSVLSLSLFIAIKALKVDPFIFFLYHPIFQSLFILFTTLSILVLQPTHTPQQKAQGQKAHAALMLFAMLSLFAGAGSIEYNKIKNNGPHFHSPHGILGVVVGIWFLLQYVGGFTMLNTPRVYGGEAKAKSVWKYHRRMGYVLYFAILVAVVGSGATDFVKGNMFSVAPPAVMAGLTAVGLYSRVRKEKLGFKAN